MSQVTPYTSNTVPYMVNVTQTSSNISNHSGSLLIPNLVKKRLESQFNIHNVPRNRTEDPARRLFVCLKSEFLIKSKENDDYGSFFLKYLPVLRHLDSRDIYEKCMKSVGCKISKKETGCQSGIWKIVTIALSILCGVFIAIISFLFARCRQLQERIFLYRGKINNEDFIEAKDELLDRIEITNSNHIPE